MYVKNKAYLKWSNLLITISRKRDKSKYFYFHKGHGHDTSGCWALKEKIEELIKQENLKELIENANIKKMPCKLEDRKEKGKAPI